MRSSRTHTQERLPERGTPAAAQSVMPSIALPAAAPTADHFPPRPLHPWRLSFSLESAPNLTDVTDAERQNDDEGQLLAMGHRTLPVGRLPGFTSIGCIGRSCRWSRDRDRTCPADIDIRIFVKEPEIWVESQRQQKAQHREVRAPLFSIFKPEMLGNTPTTCLMMASAFVVYYANYALFLTGSPPGGAAPGGDRGSSIDSPLEGDGFELPVPRIIMPAVRCGRGCRARFRRLYSQPRSASAGSDQHRTARRFEVPHLVARCGGSAARPDEAINQRRVCPVVW